MVTVFFFLLPIILYTSCWKFIIESLGNRTCDGTVTEFEKLFMSTVTDTMIAGTRHLGKNKSKKSILHTAVS